MSDTQQPKPPANPDTSLTRLDPTGEIRTGEDMRRRGWFWHWNELHTEFGPLLQHSGVGLLTSYIVWTDHRESSPYRGYAFPSLQTQAAFSGTDRAELMTINLILVALDLIEIEKRLIPRTDAQGHKWQVPHNFYKIRDRDEQPDLTSKDVLAVLQIADQRIDVYRHIRHILTPVFEPIGPKNCWHALLIELRMTPLWQRLAEREDARFSARSKAGHRKRQAAEGPSEAVADPEPAQSGKSRTSSKGDKRKPVSPSAPAIHQESDPLGNPETISLPEPLTVVGQSNNGLETVVAQSNYGLETLAATSVALSNNLSTTVVAQSNTIEEQTSTTTTTTPDQSKKRRPVTRTEGAVTALVTNQPRRLSQEEMGPDGVFGPERERALRAFRDANSGICLPRHERYLEEIAHLAGSDGWRWIQAAIAEALDSGSEFVATKRIREIVRRWLAEGVPNEIGGELWVLGGERVREQSADVRFGRSPQGRRSKRVRNGGVIAGVAEWAMLEQEAAVIAAAIPVGDQSPGLKADPGIRAEPEPAPAFWVAEAGVGSGELWDMVCDLLVERGAIRSSDRRNYLTGAAVVERNGERSFVVRARDEQSRTRIARSWQLDVEDAFAEVLGGRGWQITVVAA